MGRISDIAALHYNHISVAMGQGDIAAALPHIHNALACYATLRVINQPLILRTEKEVSIIESLRNLFLTINYV